MTRVTRVISKPCPRWGIALSLQWWSGFVSRAKRLQKSSPEWAILERRMGAQDKGSAFGQWIWVGLTAVTLLAVVAVLGVRHRSLLSGSLLAVLPLHNLSSVPNTEYFADGMTEELITELSAIPELQVVSDSSTVPVKDGPESLTEAANKLGVDAVVQDQCCDPGDKIYKSTSGCSTRGRTASFGREDLKTRPGMRLRCRSTLPQRLLRVAGCCSRRRSEPLDDTKPLDPPAYVRIVCKDVTSSESEMLKERSRCFDARLCSIQSMRARGRVWRRDWQTRAPSPGKKTRWRRRKLRHSTPSNLALRMAKPGRRWDRLLKHDWTGRPRRSTIATGGRARVPAIKPSCWARSLSIVGRQDRR